MEGLKTQSFLAVPPDKSVYCWLNTLLHEAAKCDGATDFFPFLYAACFKSRAPLSALKVFFAACKLFPSTWTCVLFQKFRTAQHRAQTCSNFPFQTLKYSLWVFSLFTVASAINANFKVQNELYLSCIFNILVAILEVASDTVWRTFPKYCRGIILMAIMPSFEKCAFSTLCPKQKLSSLAVEYTCKCKLSMA